MNSKKAFHLLILFPILIVFLQIEGSSKEKTLYLNKAFYYKLWRMKTIKRDSTFSDHLNKRIQVRGTVITVKDYDRYRKRFRIQMTDKSAAQYGFTIFLYVFLNNEDTVKLLSKGTTFEVKGQLMAYTPLNTQRSSYILDLILEDGAVVID
jgi:RNase P/RNase MRP subunit p29